MNKYLKNYLEYREKADFKRLERYEVPYLNEDKQLKIIQEDGFNIEYIENPSEDIQLAAIKQNGNAIKYILDKGIIPSEELQLVAIEQNGDAIKHIIEKGIIPSEELQLAAVQKSNDAVNSILENGITPSEEVLISSFKVKFRPIVNKILNQDLFNILNTHKIVPSEYVQKNVVKKSGLIIETLINNGIEPSEQVQFLAVKENPKSFEYILNPYPSVIKLYKELTNN